MFLFVVLFFSFYSKEMASYLREDSLLRNKFSNFFLMIFLIQYLQDENMKTDFYKWQLSITGKMVEFWVLQFLDRENINCKHLTAEEFCKIWWTALSMKCASSDERYLSRESYLKTHQTQWLWSSTWWIKILCIIILL